MLHSWLGPVPAGGGTQYSGTSVSGGGSGGGASYYLIGEDVTSMTPGLGMCSQGYGGGQSSNSGGISSKAACEGSSVTKLPALTQTSLNTSIGQVQC
jgi:hypothetical protein